MSPTQRPHGDQPTVLSAARDGGSPAPIAGSVTVDGGEPVDGATLTLVDVAGQQVDHAVTDERGGYRLHPHANGDYIVIAAHHGHHPHASRVTYTGTARRHDVELAGATELTGRVLREPGAEGRVAEPVAGVIVTLSDAGGQVIAGATTDDRGRYALTGFEFEDGHYTLTAGTAGAAPVATSLRLPADARADHDVLLPTTAALAGTVRSAATGRALPESLVALSNGDGVIVATGVADADGRFRFTGLPADDSYTLTASGHAPVSTAAPLAAGADEQVTVRLGPPATGDAPPRADVDGREPSEPQRDIA